MNQIKRTYRAIKYVWNPEWIGEEHFNAELKAAKAVCILEIIDDWCQDQGVTPTESQQKLTAMHINKYGQCTVQKHIDKCYTKVILEVQL